jgi:hypothetical protein
VQIQALELLRTRRIFTRTSVQTAPKQFLFIALVGAACGDDARVTPHLNDFFYLSHWHDPEEHGFPYLDEELDRQTGADGYPLDDDDDDASTTSSASVVKVNRHSSHTIATARTSTPLPAPPNTTTTTTTPPLLTDREISHLSHLTQTTYTSTPILRYQANLIAFLRTHRAVAPGSVTPTATRHLEQLCKALAPLHGLGYVTPALVALALRKVYLHRICVVTDPARERSVQWGSDKGLVGEVVLAGVGAGEVVEEVLGSVGVPG